VHRVKLWNFTILNLITIRRGPAQSQGLPLVTHAFLKPSFSQSQLKPKVPIAGVAVFCDKKCYDTGACVWDRNNENSYMPVDNEEQL
jgi:hypothetical protein